MKHTPGPWHQNANCKQEIVFSDGASVRTIAQCPSNLGYYDAKKNHSEAVANAELIVRAVNSHNALVNALSLLVCTCFDAHRHGWNETEREHIHWAIVEAQAAMKKARGEA